MRFVKRSVQFFKAEDQIGRGCDRELAGGPRVRADCRDHQHNNNQTTPHAGWLYLQRVAQARTLEHRCNSLGVGEGGQPKLSIEAPQRTVSDASKPADRGTFQSANELSSGVLIS